MSDVTRILSAIEQGDAQATEQLLPLVYQRNCGGWPQGRWPRGVCPRPLAVWTDCVASRDANSVASRESGYVALVTVGGYRDIGRTGFAKTGKSSWEYRLERRQRGLDVRVRNVVVMQVRRNLPTSGWFASIEIWLTAPRCREIHFPNYVCAKFVGSACYPSRYHGEDLPAWLCVGRR